MIVISFYKFDGNLKDELGIDSSVQDFIMQNLPSVRFDGFDMANDDTDVLFFQSENEKADIVKIENLLEIQTADKAVNFHIFIDEFVLPLNFWDDFDFSDGDLVFANTGYDNEILNVNYLYRETYDREIYLNLWAESYSNKFTIEIRFDLNTTPVAFYSCKTIKGLKSLVKMALEQVHKEIEDQRLSYYGDMWKTINVYLD